MARVVVTPVARDDLLELIETHQLPASTEKRISRALEPLRAFPRIGACLTGKRPDLRFLIGPWAWMLVVYRFDEADDLVSVVRIVDGRRSGSPRTGGERES